ncbi:MAG TPA: hypothetical protein VMU48_17485, partial [Terracidiphilus sp.]|nr:hypothetical protein [Terracidiphilus sp.]
PRATVRRMSRSSVPCGRSIRREDMHFPFHFYMIFYTNALSKRKGNVADVAIPSGRMLTFLLG